LNSLFVKALGVQFAAFDPSNLGCDQCLATAEILGAVFLPDCELLVMGRERLQMPGPLIGRYRGVKRSVGERAIKRVLRNVKK
jgi:hypothetical protein